MKEIEGRRWKLRTVKVIEGIREQMLPGELRSGSLEV
jgi:hypothetical protein